MSLLFRHLTDRAPARCKEAEIAHLDEAFVQHMLQETVDEGFSGEYTQPGKVSSREIKNISRLQKGEGVIWQRRCWEKVIWDEADLQEMKCGKSMRVEV